MDHSQPSPRLDIEALLREESWIRVIARDLVQDASRADDVVQDVLSAALQQRPRVRGSQLRAWLRTVTRRAAGAERRLEERRARAEHEAIGRAEDAADASSRLELHRRLHDALQALPEIDRTALVLRYLNELSPAELAARLGIPETAARKRVSRGLAHLRERLDRDCGERRAWAVPLALLAPGTERVAPGVGLSATLISLVTMKKALAAVLVVVGLALVVDRFTSERTNVPDTTRAAAVAPQLEGPRAAGEATTAVAPRLTRSSDPRREVRAQPEAVAATAPRLVVLDPDGNPVLNAVAVSIDVQGNLHELALDSDATALLPLDFEHQTFLASAPGFAASRVQPNGVDPLPLVMPLLHTVTLHGRVFVDGGTPSEPIALTCSPHRYDLLPEADLSGEAMQRLEELGLVSQKARTTTTPLGEFRFEGQHPRQSGSIELPSSYRREANRLDNRAHYTSPEERITIEATRYPYLFGHVRWAHNGEPCAGRFSGIRWSEDGAAGAGVSGDVSSSGRFEVALLDREGGEYVGGSIALRFKPEDGTPLAHNLRFEVETKDSPIDLGAITIERIDFTPIRVVNSDGDPISGASVFSSWSWSSSTPIADRERTQTDGLVAVMASADETLAILCPGYACFQSALNELPRGLDGVHLAQLTRGAQLRVTTPTVRLFPLHAKVGVIEVEYAGPDPEQRLILPGGALEGLRDGRSSYFPGNVKWEVAEMAQFSLSDDPLEINGLELGREIVVSLKTGMGELVAEQRLTLPLEPGVVEVALVPEEGERNRLTVTLPNLPAGLADEVQVSLHAENRRTGQSFRAGTSWCFDPLSTGVYQLKVQCPGYMQHSQSLQLFGEHRNLAITLQPGREIRVKLIVEADRQVLPDSFHLEAAGGWRSESCIPGRPGRYQPGDIFSGGIPFSGLPLGPVTLVATYGDEEVLIPVLADEDSVAIEARE